MGGAAAALHLPAADLRPYCLRHTYGTDLQDADVPINVAKYLMGHEDIATTGNIYTDTTEYAILAASEKIEIGRLKKEKKHIPDDKCDAK
jgi:integrase